MRAEAEIKVSKHDSTNGIKLYRRTPESILSTRKQQLVIPDGNVPEVLAEMAEIWGYRLIEEETAQELADDLDLSDDQ